MCRLLWARNRDWRIQQPNIRLSNAKDEEYNFSKGDRGKFYNPHATMNLPVYLDNEVLDYFLAKARAKGVGLNKMINELLKKILNLLKVLNNQA